MFEANQNTIKMTIGGVLVVIGVLVGIAQLSGFSAGQSLWPLYIIAPGLVLLGFGNQPNDLGKGLTIAGSVVTATGLLLAYQNTFDHFQSWAYAWALVAPGGTGIGLYLHGRRTDDAALAATGRRLVNIAATLFLFGAIFFEMIINISGRGMPELFTGSLLLPGLLVVAGLAVLFWPRRKDN